MKVAFKAALLSSILAFVMPAWALPPSCGVADAKFRVTEGPVAAAAAAAPEGKAQIVVIQTVDTDGLFYLHNDIQTRIGVDGAWAGAVQNEASAALTIEPGEHHLCVSWTGPSSAEWKRIGLAAVHAEAGKTYFYRVRIVRLKDTQTGSADESLDLMALNEDEGRYLAGNLPVDTSVAKAAGKKGSAGR